MKGGFIMRKKSLEGKLMKRFKPGRGKILILLASLLLFSLGTTQLFAADYTIRVALAHAPSSSWVKAMQLFEKELEQMSGGRIDVQVHHSATLGTTREQCEMVRLNTLEVAVPGSAQLQTYTPEIGLTVLPYIFKTEEGMFKLLDGALGKEIDSKLAESNFINIGWYRNGFRSVTNNKRPIYKMEDLKGLKLRVLPSPNVMAFFKAIGVTPIHIDWAELFEAMRKGVVDGQENPPFFVWQGKVYEVNQYYSFTNHMDEPGIAVMSKKFYDGLPADLRKMVDTAAKKAEMWQREKMLADNAECLQLLKGKGMKINDVPESELQKLREVAYKQVFPTVIKDKMCGPRTKELIDMILAAQK
jgi:tripartite ATP-independent transporter DctP family solute receptor